MTPRMHWLAPVVVALVLAGCSMGSEANSKPSTHQSTGGTSAIETQVCRSVTQLGCPGLAFLTGIVKSSDPSHPLSRQANVWIRTAQLTGSHGGRACTLNQCGISAGALRVGSGLAPGRWVFVPPAMSGFRRPLPIKVSLQSGRTTALSIVYYPQG
jgi:hypothetical protein